jgi:hypothetical protein
VAAEAVAESLAVAHRAEVLAVAVLVVVSAAADFRVAALAEAGSQLIINN